MSNKLREDKLYLTRNEAYILYWYLKGCSDKLTEKLRKNYAKEKPRCMSDELGERNALDKLIPALCRFYLKADKEIEEERKIKEEKKDEKA